MVKEVAQWIPQLLPSSIVELPSVVKLPSVTEAGGTGSINVDARG